VNLTRAVPPDAPVQLVEDARLIADCDMDYQFDLGLDLILAGLERRLKQKTGLLTRGGPRPHEGASRLSSYLTGQSIELMSDAAVG
jgi:hypothetical protein